jgi:TRAP transporter TAXI family solute receptor
MATKKKNAKKRRSSDGASVYKAIAVLRTFIDGQDAWGVRELANALGQPGSSVHRLLQILRKDGLIEWDAESQKYRSGMEFFRWSAVLSRRLKLAEVARPTMADLSAAFGESCWLGLYEPVRRAHAYVAEVLADRPLNYSATIARYEPLWNSAGGLAVLAFLSEPERQAILAEACALGKHPRMPSSLTADLRRIRLDGYAMRVGVDEDAPITIAAPIFNARNLPIGSLTLAIPPHRSPADGRNKIGLAVGKFANKLSRLIGSQVLGAAGGGTWHQGVIAIANLIHREVPEIGSTISNLGGDGALRELQLGRGGYCFAVAGSLEAAYKGKPPFEGRHDRLCAMFNLFPLFLHVVAKRDSDVRSFADLRRRKISAGEKDFTTAHVVTDLIWRAGLAGNTATAQRRLVFLDYPEAHREFVQGKLDTVISLTGLGDPSFCDLARRTDIRLLTLDDKLAKNFVGANPTYEQATIPGSTYHGWDHPTATIMVPTVMVTTDDRSDEEVYAVTRALYQNRSELASISPDFDPFDPRFIFRGIEIPLHPGAERFWIERGLLKHGRF